jgi:circadian clock protein KaiC
MKKRAATIRRLETGVRNLDAIFHGGLPRGSVTVVSGPPGSGKTTIAQQICFHNATPTARALYFNTLSEPTAKSLRYVSQFAFFDREKIEAAVEFVDLGVILRTRNLAEASALIMEQVKRSKPAIVVVDSFKVFDDLATSSEDLRKFDYELAVNLMAWETTALLLGEYGANDYQTNPLFSVVDGMLLVTHREASGEQQRFLQLRKMRGTAHSAEEYPFVINESGVDIYAPRLTLTRTPIPEERSAPRLTVGIQKLDELLGAGIPLGSSLLVSGVAGTGKTLLLLEFIYRGALAGEKGIMFSFEETADRLRATALGMGWDMEREIARGMIEIEFIPQPDIVVEKHLLMMQERVVAMGARRVAIDSVSVFMHKITDVQVARDKMFQLATVIHNASAVGFFATDVPYGSPQISRFGVEETVVDGVILLTAAQEGAERRRYLEVYKLRNTAHLQGRHNLAIARGGIQVFPRVDALDLREDAPPPVERSKRLSTGIPRLDELVGGGLLARSMTLVSGSAGTGKTTLGIQFLLAGAKRRQPGVYVTLEEGPDQILASASGLGLALREAVDAGLVEILYLSRASVRAGQFASLLTDAIHRTKARRLVLDSASHFVTYGVDEDELRQLLYGLVRRLKMLDVTSLFTLESKALFSADRITDRDLSPTSDNLIVLRYDDAPERLDPFLSVVKTRGSAHDAGIYRYGFGEGGIHIGTGRREVAIPQAPTPPAEGGPRKKRPRRGGG